MKDSKYCIVCNYKMRGVTYLLENNISMKDAIIVLNMDKLRGHYFHTLIILALPNDIKFFLNSNGYKDLQEYLLQQKLLIPKNTTYYTPEPEEFHIGFEYEWNSSDEDDIWRPAIADLEDCYHAVQDIQQKTKYQNYRVKYLDKEDIESFNLKCKVTDCGEDTEKDKLDIYVGNNTIVGSFYPTDRKQNLILVDTIFTIKNKSELKILLKQLSICQ